MKTIEKTVKITFTLDEIELITTAMHGEYKHIKDLINNCTPEQRRRLIEKCDNVKTIRNNFAELINRHYMGDDA